MHTHIHNTHCFVVFPDQVIEMVKKDDQGGVPVMVFCNEIPTCDWLAQLLEEHNIKVLRLHGSMTTEVCNFHVCDLCLCLIRDRR